MDISTYIEQQLKGLNMAAFEGGLKSVAVKAALRVYISTLVEQQLNNLKMACYRCTSLARSVQYLAQVVCTTR